MYRCVIILFLLTGLCVSGQQKADLLTAVPGTTQRGYASYYHNMFEGRKTTSGERYSKKKLTAAHRTLPLGTRVKVTELKTKRWVIVRINDRGPRPKKRIIDLSRRAAKHLGMLNGKGVIKVEIEVLPEIQIVPQNEFRRNEAE